MIEQLRQLRLGVVVATKAKGSIRGRSSEREIGVGDSSLHSGLIS